MSTAMSAVACDEVGPLELLVIQPTPFCNLDGSYCYLPNHAGTRRMSHATLDRAFRWVAESGLVREPFTLLWHAGEPLVIEVGELVSHFLKACPIIRRCGCDLAQEKPAGSRPPDSFWMAT